MEESTTITIEHGGISVAIKLPWDADAETIVSAWVGAMIAIGFHRVSVADAMEAMSNEIKSNEE